MNRTVEKIWNIVTWVLMGVILLGAALAVLPRFFGLKTFNVLTPSMASHNPNSEIQAEDVKGHIGLLPVGSLIYVKPVDINDVEQYDVVTRHIGGIYLTHRVVEVTTGEDGETLLVTQGDANDTPDGPIGQANLAGKVVFCIPALGAILNDLQSPPGLYLGLAAGALLVLLMFLPDILDGLLKKEATAKGEAEAAPAEPKDPQ